MGDAQSGAQQLRNAAADGKVNKVRLLAAGADVNAAGADGQTALILAAGEGDLSIVELLLAAGADVNAVAADGEH